MSKQWPTVSLGDVLTERRETPSPYDIETGKIRIVSKIGFKDGRMLLREGCQTNTGMILIRPGDIVVSGINAAKGAIAIYDEANKDTIAATIHYGAYIPNKDKADARWLWWFLRSQDFRNLLLEYVPGGIKTELKSKRLLPVPICIPSLSEQRRIVARIEKLAAKTEEAQKLRRQAAEEAELLTLAEMDKIFNNVQKTWNVLPIRECPLELNRETRNPVNVNPTGEFQYLDISSVEGGTGRILGTQKLLGRNAPSRARRVIRQGNVIMSTVRPNLKSFTIVPPELDNQICSTGFAVFSCYSDIEPKFLQYQIFSNYFVDQCIESMKGGHYPAVNEKNLQQINLMLPPLSEQRRIVAYLDGLQAKADALRKLQEETGNALDALMPAVLDRAFKGEL